MIIQLQNQTRKTRSLPYKNTGFSMVAALVALLALVFIGASSVRNSVMQERMAGNSKDMNLAFQAGESALRDAEMDISKNITLLSAFTADCAAGLCTGISILNSVNWSNSKTTRTYGQYTHSKSTPVPPLPVVSAQPIYIIEKLPPINQLPGESVALGMPSKLKGQVYRITVYATGARKTTRVMLQSIYRKQ